MPIIQIDSDIWHPSYNQILTSIGVLLSDWDAMGHLDLLQQVILSPSMHLPVAIAQGFTIIGMGPMSL